MHSGTEPICKVQVLEGTTASSIHQSCAPNSSNTTNPRAFWTLCLSANFKRSVGLAVLSDFGKIRCRYFPRFLFFVQSTKVIEPEISPASRMKKKPQKNKTTIKQAKHRLRLFTADCNPFLYCTTGLVKSASLSAGSLAVLKGKGT